MVFRLSTPTKSTSVVTVLFVGSILDNFPDVDDNLSDSTCRSLNFLNPEVWFKDPTISFHSSNWTFDFIEYEKAW